jgi:hypothetical protein
MLYYLIIPTSEYLEKTCVQGGVKLIHLMNYIRIYPLSDGVPLNSDGGMSIYRIDVPDQMVQQVNEGPVKHTLLWKGDKSGRAEIGAMITMPVYPVSGGPVPVEPVQSVPAAPILTADQVMVEKLKQEVQDLGKALEATKDELAKVRTDLAAAQAETKEARRDAEAAKAERNKLSIQRTHAGATRVPTKE